MIAGARARLAPRRRRALRACPALRPGPLPWRTGEVLQYDLEVMGMVKAGTMSLEAGRPMFDGHADPASRRG